MSAGQGASPAARLWGAACWVIVIGTWSGIAALFLLALCAALWVVTP